jgi:photosystem II stability/assembly factor-like uncharacterized protein
MKKIVCLIITGLTLLANSSFSQEFWQQVPLPVPGASVSTLNIDNNGLLVLGLEDNIYYSSDNGVTWTETTNWPGYMARCIAFNSSHHVFIGTYSDGILRSTDGGVSFTELHNGLTFANIWCLAVLDNGDILAGTPGGIFRSSDNGDVWALYGTGLPDDEINQLSKGDNGKVFAGTKTNGIYFSGDNGATWVESNNGIPDSAQVTALIAVPGLGEIYAGLFIHGMYRSLDDGNTWTECNLGLPYGKNTDFARGHAIMSILPMNPYILCVIYLFGVFLNQLSFMPGQPWITEIAGLSPEPQTTSMARDTTSLLLGAGNQGLYRNNYPVHVTEPPGNSCECTITHYPNPVTSGTSFNFTIPDKRTVTVELFNHLGQKIMTIANSTYPVGTHQIIWESTGLIPGMYFYTLTAGDCKISQKMILM